MGQVLFYKWHVPLCTQGKSLGIFIDRQPCPSVNSLPVKFSLLQPMLLIIAISLTDMHHLPLNSLSLMIFQMYGIFNVWIPFTNAYVYYKLKLNK